MLPECKVLQVREGRPAPKAWLGWPGPRERPVWLGRQARRARLELRVHPGREARPARKDRLGLRERQGRKARPVLREQRVTLVPRALRGKRVSGVRKVLPDRLARHRK